MIKAAAQPDALLGWMDSLADPTRLRLLRLLEGRELGVVDLCQVLQMPQSTVSRHLKVLNDQGWTESRRQGTTNLYAFRGDELDEAAQRLWGLATDQTHGWATLQQDQLRLTQRLRQREDSQAFFAGAAGDWDKLRSELYGTNVTDLALPALLPADWVVADLGCGTGQTAAALAQHVAKVIAVDNSPAMLKAARKRLAKLGHVELRRGDLETLPIEDAACDAAVMMLVLTYVQDPLVVLTEMARVTRRGGRAVVVDLLRHAREDFRRQMGQVCLGFEADELKELLTRAGFASARCQTLPPDPQAKGPALVLASATK
jgi:ubiquinone/menaquinone biosynthesis C-methylase UbiE